MLTKAQGATGHQVGVLDGLLEHRCAARIPGAGPLGGGYRPQHLVVGRHAIHRRASCATGQVKDVDTAPHGLGGPGLDGARGGLVAQGIPQASDRKDRGNGCATRVHRQPTIGLEGVDKVALVTAQGRVLAVAQGKDQIALVLVKIAKSPRHADTGDVAAPMLGPVGERRGLQSVEVLAQDEIDHAANRIRAVNG